MHIPKGAKPLSSVAFALSSNPPTNDMNNEESYTLPSDAQCSPKSPAYAPDDMSFTVGESSCSTDQRDNSDSEYKKHC